MTQRDIHKACNSSDKVVEQINFNFIARNLGLPQGPNICCFALRSGDSVVESAIERSMAIKDAVVVLLCHKGGCAVAVDGVQCALVAEQLLIIFPNNTYHFSSPTIDFEATILVGHINPNATYNSLAKSFPKILLSPILTLVKEEYDTIFSLFQYIKHSLRNPNNSHRAELDVGILSVMHDELADVLLRRRYEMKEQSQGEQMVRQFEIMLSVSTFEHRDVDYYAEQFNLSPKRFAAIVKKYTGKTPSAMITSALISAAKRLLVCTDLNSSEISEKLNFASPSFFCRYFRHYTGQTPIAWRLSHAQTHPQGATTE